MGAQLERFRRRAIAHTLFPVTTLGQAIARLGFVQADPIRAPARAQDLILRHRVGDYRAGDLEREYPALALDEGLLHVYGFLPSPSWTLLHPGQGAELTALEADVLSRVRATGVAHPQQLLGEAKVRNAWGGQSRAVKVALEDLHLRGLLRVQHRQSGVRCYASAPPTPALSPDRQFRRLVMLVASLLAPVLAKTLRSLAARLRNRVATTPDHRAVVRGLCDRGELIGATLAGREYLTPSNAVSSEPVMDCVRFLAPFDPLVWDRERFEQLWQWSYRFEAYTPAAKRVRGYYAMPVLWQDDVVGWANARVVEACLQVELGFARGRPGDSGFSQGVARELARFAAFLGVSEARLTGA